MMKNFLQKMMLLAFTLFATISYAATINVTSDITTNTTWTNDNIYVLFGEILVKNNATLTIQAGTIIKGNSATVSRLVITTTGKINAQGTATQPIVFTSEKPVGQRSRGDWAGIAILGSAPCNFKDANNNPIQGRLECGTTTDYDFGGSNADDSSGVMRYVRIEYAGYVCGTNTELNSLTLGGVGRKTVIEHVQVSYGQDDGFEFFGGTVGGKGLISFASRDDDFDTDNGWSGSIQYGLIIRVDTIADQGDISNAFESDNDAGGSANTPITAGVFSNVTVIGPAPTTTSIYDSKYGWGGRLRRNTSISIFNSAFIGYHRGLRIEGAAAQANATAGSLVFRNNVIAGTVQAYGETAFDSTLINAAVNSNKVYGGNANDSVKLVSPYGNPNNYDFTLQSGSPLLTGADFSHAKLNGFESTAFRGAFGTNDWSNCWAEFTPNDENYTVGPIDYSYNATFSASGPTTFCQGNSVALSVNTAASGATYHWSNGATTSSINVTASGTYTVTVANARGCKKTFSQVVTVNSNPTATATPTNTSFCTGSAGVTISSSAATSYLWSNGATTQNITVTNSGAYTVTVTDANGCTAVSNAVQITQFNPLVPVIGANGPTSFCTGDDVDLSVNTPSNFNAFSWSNGGSTATINVTATGTYTVTTTDNNGCTAVSNSITTSVSSSPTPTISANGTVSFCNGDSVTLTSTAGETYAWSNGASTQSIVVKTAGNYTVIVTNNANPCLGVGTSNSITVAVTPQPVANFTQAASGSSYTIAFTNTSTNATAYNWNFGNNQSSTQANPTHTYTQNGTYTVTLTATNGNCTDVKTMQITITGVGFEEVTNNIESIRLFPNPNNGLATLEINSNAAATVTVSVMEITGKEISSTNVDVVSGNNQMQISTADFAQGVYLVRIANGAEARMVRMVVNK
ncbi:MAG: PKD domain-containing protein [Chitinophagales bacterium]|nr:PKD domain-containing protein [Chitinophagales bacterium]